MRSSPSLFSVVGLSDSFHSILLSSGTTGFSTSVSQHGVRITHNGAARDVVLSSTWTLYSSHFHVLVTNDFSIFT